MKKVVCGIFLFIFGLSFSQRKWSLRNCLEYAIENNLQISAEKINLENQRKNLQISKKNRLPNVSGSMNNSVNFGQNVILGTLQRNDNLSNNANISANIQIYENGRLKKSIEKSRYDVETSEYNLENIKNNISLQIIQSYLQILLNKEIYRLNSNSFENAENLYSKAKLTTKAGVTPFSVESETLAEVSRKKQSMLNSENEVKRALFSLTVLLQIDDDENFDVEDFSVSEAEPEMIESVSQYLEQAYKTQPAIKAAEAQIKSAKKQREITKTSLYPSLSGGVGLGTYYFNYFNDTYSKSLPFFEQYRSNFGQQVSISAVFPIFNKGITRLQIEQAKMQETLAENNYSQQKLLLKQEVKKAVFDANANYQNFVAATEVDKNSRLSLGFAEKSYVAGRISIYDLNVARNNEISAQSELIQARYNYIFSMKLLDFYAGKDIR